MVMWIYQLDAAQSILVRSIYIQKEMTHAKF
jgi:hypothetical protein